MKPGMLHLALRPGRQHGTITTTTWPTFRPSPPAYLWTVVNKAAADGHKVIDELPLTRSEPGIGCGLV